MDTENSQKGAKGLFYIADQKEDNTKHVMNSIIDTYNSSSHWTLKNKTPNQVFKDKDEQMARSFKKCS